MLSLVQDWLDTRNATDVHFYLWLLVKLFLVLESTFVDNLFKTVVILDADATFTNTLFLFSQLSIKMLKCSPFSNDLLWFNILVEGVSDHLPMRVLNYCMLRDARYVFCMNSNLTQTENILISRYLIFMSGKSE